MSKNRPPQGFVAYLRITCHDDRDQIKAQMCSGAKNAIKKALTKPSSQDAPYFEPFYFCIHNCYPHDGRTIELVRPEEVEAARLTGQLEEQLSLL